MNKDDNLYLTHIQECIDKIRCYLMGDKERFMTSTLIQDAVLRNLQVMAESTQKLSPEFKQKHPDILWRELWAFRNVIAHNYLGISLERIWEVIEEELPKLEQILK